MKKKSVIFLALFLLPVLLFASASGLGRIDFPTSGSPKAQEKFIRGALLLHSFQYDEAVVEFQDAEKIQPDFAMAYWGEAMTYTHPIWVEQDMDAAKKALAKLAPTPEARLAKAKTEREKDYLRAIEILYGEGDKTSRDKAYSDFMGRMREKYPDDLEAASFYALALLGTCEYKRDIPTYMKAAAVAEEVFQKNPLHPGAVHYLIHSYDDPVHAPLGLRAARVYAKIAPDAVHALHMPSHIFLALGMWPEVISSNEASWAASKQKSFHAVHWLQYANLQAGHYEEARKLLAFVEGIAKATPTMYAEMHLSMMRAGYLIETQQWDSDALKIVVDRSTLEPDLVAVDLFATGMSAIKTKDAEGAAKMLAEMKSLREKAKAPDNPRSLVSAEIMEMELDALIRSAAGNSDEAVKLLQDAAAKEDAQSFDFGPPVPVKPVHELLGELLLSMGRKSDAKAQFELCLSRAPNRALSTKGLALCKE